MYSEKHDEAALNTPFHVSNSTGGAETDLPENEIAAAVIDGAQRYAQICLYRLPDDCLLNKHELAKALGCSWRTINRMVQRFEIPPGITLCSREFWIAGRVKAWIAESEAKAEKEAQRLRRAQPRRKQ
jgi:predicted DNA-binding transcriptional regulator AlpA